ncbi:MAG: hypothetical protein WAV25_01570 [Minisyncoccia bacterium]
MPGHMERKIFVLRLICSMLQILGCVLLIPIALRVHEPYLHTSWTMVAVGGFSGVVNWFTFDPDSRAKDSTAWLTDTAAIAGAALLIIALHG